MIRVDCPRMLRAIDPDHGTDFRLAYHWPVTEAPIVVDYDPGWSTRACALRGGLRSLLAPLALHVEHIGSTSIPGMAAKPILDLQVSVGDLAEAEQRFDGPLAGLGFQRMPYLGDHVPAGSGDSPERWAKRMWRRRGHPEGDVNLHVRLAGSPNERLALLFRDWFRAHPEAIPSYAKFKADLARETGDVGPYTDIKDSVVDLIIAVAEPWAAAARWAPHVA
jgi:GrpB-like predicted nucleotidyltransferase (UPF0157 family)